MLLAAESADLSVWKSIGLPIVVALLTTLATEWLLKPRLEARKERIGRRYRGRDDFVDQVLELSTRAEFLTHSLPLDLQAEAEADWLAERERATERVRSITADMWDNKVRHAALYPWPVRDLVPQYISHVHRLQLAARTPDYKAKTIRAVGLLLLDIIRPGRMIVWRWKRVVVGPGHLKRTIAEQTVKLDEDEVYWASPEGQQFRAKVLEANRDMARERNAGRRGSTPKDVN